jgi:hypothetical protein
MDMSQGSAHAGSNGREFPRSLSRFERELILWLLPKEKSGYEQYRKYIEAWVVVSEGRRGSGNYILAVDGTVADNDSPLPPVFAYGVIETSGGNISVTLRELFYDQLEFEIMNLSGPTVPVEFVESRRWNFSPWMPGDACPACGKPSRQVSLQRENGPALTLSLCVTDKRLWIHDASDGVNHLIPVTNFYNELMLHKHIRDPKKALDSNNLFADAGSFSDDDLAAAFASYNKLRRKVELGAIAKPVAHRKTFAQKILSRFK